MNKLLLYIHLIRLHRPLPILLLLWPVFWALWIAAGGIPPIKILIIFTLGVFLMRSAGGVINDMADHKFDCLVERTQARPITSGQLSLRQAASVAAGLILLAFILVCFLNPLSMALSFCALGLAIIYPFAKRFTYWPQLILGMAYNFGIIMAFAAVQNHVPPIAWWLWLIAVVWTLAYDTIYALADRPDDIKIGVRSTAVLFGKHVSLAITIMQILMLINLIAFGLVLSFDALFYLALMVCAGLFVCQHRLMKKHRLEAYVKAFSDNHWIGLILFVVIAWQF